MAAARPEPPSPSSAAPEPRSPEPPDVVLVPDDGHPTTPPSDLIEIQVVKVTDTTLVPEPPEPGSLHCALCPAAFRLVSELLFHEHGHLAQAEGGRQGGDPSRCHVCGHSCPGPASLRAHYSLHTGERPYRCALWKPFACRFCAKPFRRSSDMRDHERVHTGERPYHCGVCGKGFTQSSVLSGHARIHTGERPFRCALCDRTFNNSSNFRKHQRTHFHGPGPGPGLGDSGSQLASGAEGSGSGCGAGNTLEEGRGETAKVKVEVDQCLEAGGAAELGPRRLVRALVAQHGAQVEEAFAAVLAAVGALAQVQPLVLQQVGAGRCSVWQRWWRISSAASQKRLPHTGQRKPRFCRHRCPACIIAPRHPCQSRHGCPHLSRQPVVQHAGRISAAGAIRGLRTAGRGREQALRGRLVDQLVPHEVLNEAKGLAAGVAAVGLLRHVGLLVAHDVEEIREVLATIRARVAQSIGSARGRGRAAWATGSRCPLGGREAGGPGQGAGQLEPVHLAVAGEALRVAEDLATQLALVGPLASVHHVVLAQVEGLAEALPAHGALVRLLAGVDALVALQGLPAPEAAPADAAAERLSRDAGAGASGPAGPRSAEQQRVGPQERDGHGTCRRRWLDRLKVLPQSLHSCGFSSECEMLWRSRSERRSLPPPLPTGAVTPCASGGSCPDLGGRPRLRGREALSVRFEEVGPPGRRPRRPRGTGGARVPFHCSECGKSFRYRSDLRRHFARHTALKPHACPRCGKGFKHSFNLANHLRSHTGERPYRCSACPKGFRDSTGLLHHQVVHTGEKPYCCLVCELRFSSRSSLGRHLKRQHRGVLPSPLQPGPGLPALSAPCSVCCNVGPCSVCGGSGTGGGEGPEGAGAGPGSWGLAEAAAAAAASLPPFACGACARRFDHGRELAAHWAAHTDVKPFKCPRCERDFNKIFGCSECEKLFRSPRDLERHVLVHTGEKPFPCLECGKFFRHECYLKRHRLLHGTERPFPCHICGKGFITLSNLSRHLKLHRGMD
nr:PREDICTED: flt3-interacting zinc finger protein 1 [Equus przewalskii]